MALAIRTKVTGMSDLRRRLRGLPKRLREPITEGIEQSALKLEVAAERLIQHGGRSGTIRKVTKGGKRHQASAPGEPPKSDTGRLVGSIRHQIARDGLSAVVGTNLKYGRHLEFGTKRMKARPWLMPTWKKNLSGIKRLIAKRVDAALRRSGRGR